MRKVILNVSAGGLIGIVKAIVGVESEDTKSGLEPNTPRYHAEVYGRGCERFTNTSDSSFLISESLRKDANKEFEEGKI